MTATSMPTETASPASDVRWAVVHAVTLKVDRKHFWHVTRNERILKALERAVPNAREQRFLEVGCGAGNVIGYLHEHGLRDCTGWDINEEALRIGQRRYSAINFERCDFLQPLTATNNYDIVGLFDALEHFEDDSGVLQRVEQLVTPGGTIVITVPAMMSLWSAYDEYYGHYRRYSKKSLASLLERAGFENIRVNYMMAPLAIAMLARKKEGRAPDAEMNRRFERDSFLPDFVNAVATTILRIEQAITRGGDVGFGSALIATASRRKTS